MTAHYQKIMNKNNDEKGKRLTIFMNSLVVLQLHHLTELSALKQTIVENIGSCGKKEFS